MKPSILILIALGLLAAIAMALLTTVLGGRSAAPKGPAPVAAKVLVAARKIEPLTTLGREMVEVTTVSLSAKPAGAYSDPVQVAGRILSAPLAPGQALTPACFASQGPGVELAAQLPVGFRAVTVSLACPASLKGLLYPGSVVDVLASFPLRGGNGALGEAVSTTLLAGIQILAVDNALPAKAEPEPAGNPAPDDKNKLKTAPPPPSSAPALVTFKVDSRQAEGLQLASEFGKVSLALRNPFDSNPVKQEPTLLSQGKLAGMAEVLDAMVKQRESEQQKEEEAAPPPPEPVETPAAVAAAPEPQGWQIEAYRGVTKETISIPEK